MLGTGRGTPDIYWEKLGRGDDNRLSGEAVPWKEDSRGDRTVARVQINVKIYILPIEYLVAKGPKSYFLFFLKKLYYIILICLAGWSHEQSGRVTGLVQPELTRNFIRFLETSPL